MLQKRCMLECRLQDYRKCGERPLSSISNGRRAQSGVRVTSPYRRDSLGLNNDRGEQRCQRVEMGSANPSEIIADILPCELQPPCQLERLRIQC
jgi:hypothetical protein